MKMLIDKIKLKLLLEEKRDYINNSVDGIDTVITVIVYVISLLCCEFKPIFGINPIVLQTLAWVIAVLLLIYGIIKIVKSCKYKYNHNILFHDIENLDEILHKFSIVAIKDTYQDFANRFLLYYDNAWKCWFFFSFHTEEYQNEEQLIQRLSNSLKIDKDYIKIRYISDRLQPKYSERDHQNKVYQHSLYQGVVNQFSDEMKQLEFTIDGVRYKWFTISEMEADSNIMKKNADLISFVKEKIG